MEIAMYDSQGSDYLATFIDMYNAGGTGYSSSNAALPAPTGTVIQTAVNDTFSTPNIPATTTGGNTWNDNPNNVASEDVVVYADKKKKTNYWPWIIGGGGLLLLLALSNDNNGRK